MILISGTGPLLVHGWTRMEGRKEGGEEEKYQSNSCKWQHAAWETPRAIVTPKRLQNM